MLNLSDQYRRYPDAENASVLREYFERNPSRVWLLQDEDLLISQPFFGDHTIASVLEGNTSTVASLTTAELSPSSGATEEQAILSPAAPFLTTPFPTKRERRKKKKKEKKKGKKKKEG